jgi:Spy/CpxP family protein refolding chaperone
MKQSLRTMALGAALLAGFASVGAAQTPQGPDSARQRSVQIDGKQRGGRFGRALFRGIDLTDQQRQQVRTIREKYRPQYQELRKSAGVEGRRQRPDSATMVRLRTLSERERTEIRALLTPQQQTVFDQNIARMREHGREMRGRRG